MFLLNFMKFSVKMGHPKHSGQDLMVFINNSIESTYLKLKYLANFSINFTNIWIVVNTSEINF